MSTGADAKSMPGTATFRDEYDRIFGKDRKPERGSWVQHPQTGQLVAAEEYVPPAEEAQHAPILVDRYMEGTRSPVDGSDIGSRAKRREHMKREGVADATDFSPQYREKVRQAREAADRKALRETVGRVVYEKCKP